MSWKVRTDVAPEEVDRYAAVVADYIKSRKGWYPGEYHMRFIAVLADAPLAAFNVIHNEGVKELNESPPKAQGIHPLELQVYVQTEEMRAFIDPEEFQRILGEAQRKRDGR